MIYLVFSMSKISLILVLRTKEQNLKQDMTKVAIKSEKLTSLGGVFAIMEKFDSLMSSVIDSTLGRRCTSYANYIFLFLLAGSIFCHILSLGFRKICLIHLYY